MKTFKIILLMAVVLATTLSVSAKKKGEKTVVFNVTLHCGSCKAKVDKNIPYEKGVKKMVSDLEAQTVSITYKDDKTTEENLKKALEKLDIPVKGIKKCTDKKECTDEKDSKKKDKKKNSKKAKAEKK